MGKEPVPRAAMVAAVVVVVTLVAGLWWKWLGPGSRPMIPDPMAGAYQSGTRPVGAGTEGTIPDPTAEMYRSGSRNPPPSAGTDSGGTPSGR